MEMKENKPLLTTKIACPDCFDLDQIFNCGQAFRFERQPDGSYIGVAFSKVIRVRKKENEIVFDNAAKRDFEKIWRPYFDLDRDYAKLKACFSGDCVMQAAMAYGQGIRLLRQDSWEALITFILSQRNNIPRIKKIVASLCGHFGEPLEFEEKTYYTFPSPERIFSLSEEELALLNCGYRSGYLKEAARMVHTGEIDLKAIEKMDTDKAREALLCVKGVGQKVADCVLLFGYGRLDAFPVDVWMDRVIHTLYDKETFTKEIFGQYCGIAQQYLFYYGRETKIGK